METLIVRRPWSCWSRPWNQISNHVFLYSRFIFPDKFDDTVGCKQQIFRSSFTCSYSLPLLSLEEVEASKCSALIFSVCVKVCANSGRSSRPIEELALTPDWWTLMTLGSGNSPRQGRGRGISLVATHQHQIKQGDPTQAIYVNNLVKYRTPMDSDDFQTLPLSSAVKFSCETQRLRWPWLFCLSHQVERLTRCRFSHWDYNLRVKHDQYDIWWFGGSVKGIHNFKKKTC